MSVIGHPKRPSFHSFLEVVCTIASGIGRVGFVPGQDRLFPAGKGTCDKERTSIGISGPRMTMGTHVNMPVSRAISKPDLKWVR